MATITTPLNSTSTHHPEKSASTSSVGLNIVYRHPHDLEEASCNPRTHSKKQVRQLVSSITEFGFTNPILIDQTDRVIAGHGRLKAAKLLKLDSVPTILLNQLSANQIRAYIIADNKLAENAGWDKELLAIELQYLSGLDVDFDVSLTGFETAEIDVLIGELHEELSNEDNEIPPVQPGPSITKHGYIWKIGTHKLICGDATNPVDYEALLENERAQMIFTDPPYNVPIGGHVSGLGQVRHREFVMASGEMSKTQFIKFLKDTFTNLSRFSVDGSIHFICMDWRHIVEIMDAAEEPYTEFKNLCVWAKNNGGMGSLYRSQHELIFVFKNGNSPHINNVELGKHGRYRTNVWNYAGMNSFGGDRDAELASHPTVKPLDLVADAILDCSDRGEIILDTFSGSGTTLLAAEQTGRRGFGIELDPHYCDVIIRRMIACGLSAIHTQTGTSFEELEMTCGTSEESTS